MPEKYSINEHKTYIFLTFNIRGAGGGQSYVNAKVDYLKKRHWSVYVISPFGPTEVDWPLLKEYHYLQMLWLNRDPRQLTKRQANNLVKDITRILQPIGRVVIESHNEILAIWAELLASSLNAKHLFFSLNERFRGPDKSYDLSFCDFKHKRKELACINQAAMVRLFEDFKLVHPSQCYSLAAKSSDCIQDIPFSIPFSLKSNEWKIGLVSRLDKDYIPTAVDEIARFAREHHRTHIQLVVIGDSTNHHCDIFQPLAGISNLTLTEMGHMYPIPENIIKALDVIIATAGCAKHCAVQRVPVITVDCQTYEGLGILGYTTGSATFSSPDDMHLSLSRYLHIVLNGEGFDQVDFVKSIANWISKLMPADDVYDEHFKFMASSDMNLAYYTFTHNCRGPIASLKAHIMKISRIFLLLFKRLGSI